MRGLSKKFARRSCLLIPTTIFVFVAVGALDLGGHTEIVAKDPVETAVKWMQEKHTGTVDHARVLDEGGHQRVAVSGSIDEDTIWVVTVRREADGWRAESSLVLDSPPSSRLWSTIDRVVRAEGGRLWIVVREGANGGTGLAASSETWYDANANMAQALQILRSRHDANTPVWCSGAITEPRVLLVGDDVLLIAAMTARTWMPEDNSYNDAVRSWGKEVAMLALMDETHAGIVAWRSKGGGPFLFDPSLSDWSEQDLHEIGRERGLMP